MAIVFPTFSRKELRAIEKKHYRRMCDFGAEYLCNGREEPDSPKIILDNAEVLEKAFEKSDFVVCYSGHFANYELMTKLPALVNDITMYNFYQASPFKDIDDYVCGLRSKYGATLIPTDKGIRTLISLKQSGQKRVVIGSLADLINNSNPTYIPFFGRSYPAFSGTERIGEFLQAQFLYGNITSSDHGEYHIRLIPLEGCVTQSFFNCLEDNIREQPELWMQWGLVNL